MKRPTGSRTRIIAQVLNVIEETIPRLETIAQCDEMDTNIHTMWKQKIIDDNVYRHWKQGISNARKLIEKGE